MVPMRAIFEELGAYVHWTDSTQTVDATKGDTSVRLRIGDTVANVNGREVNLDQPPRIIGGSTMVPLRFVSESLGADVDWRASDETVLITTGAVVNTNVVAQNEQYRNRPVENRTVVVERDRQRRQGTQTRREQHALRMAFRSNAVIPVRLDQALGSERNVEGDTFTATVETNGRGNYGGIPEGTKVVGHVVRAEARNGNEPGILGLAFDEIRFPDGTSRPIDGTVTTMDAKAVRRGSDGTFVAASSVRNSGNDTPAYIGIGAGAGAVLGILSKGNVITDAVIGGALGYLLHQATPTQRNARNVHLSAGTEMGVRLRQAFNYQ